MSPAAVSPLILACIARTGKLYWPATAAASLFMLTSLSLNWTLQFVPGNAEARTHPEPGDAPRGDAVPDSPRGTRPSLLTCSTGGGAGAAMAARRILGRDIRHRPSPPRVGRPPHSCYHHLPGTRFSWQISGITPSALGPWRYEYWESIRATWAGQRVAPIGTSLFTAALVGMISARVGLAFGTWMREVRR